MHHPLIRLAAASMVLAVFGLGQEGASEAKESAEQAIVALDGRDLFQVRGVSSYPAKKRAEAIVERLREVASDPAFSTDSIKVEEVENLTRITAGGQILMAVADADAAIEGVPRKLLAEVHRQKIIAAIQAYREERRPGDLFGRTMIALTTLVLMGMLLIAVQRGFKLLGSAIEQRSRAKLASAKLKHLEVMPTEQLTSTLRATVQLVRLIVTALVVLIAIEFVLGLYPWTRPLSARLLTVVMDPLNRIGMGIFSWIPSLVFLVILTAFVRFVLRLARLYFEAINRGAISVQGFESEWAMPTFRIVRLLVIAFALVVAYPYLPGSETDAFKGISLFLGVIFSLGSSSAIANVIAGYSLTYRRAFKVGDRVAIGDIKGTVTQMRIQATHLRTVKNEEVVYPNSTILTSAVVNYSTLAKQKGLILHTTVGIGYETPWRQVEAMLLLAAERTKGLLRDPAPFVLEKSLADFAVNYELNAHIDDPHRSESLYAELHRNVLDVFNEYGVQIMTPAYEADPLEPKLVPREKWFEKPAQSTSEEMMDGDHKEAR